MNGFSRRALLAALISAAATVPAAALAQASSYPNKPIRIIVPFRGGRHRRHVRPGDRHQADGGMGPAGVVENKTGAGGQYRRRAGGQVAGRRLHAGDGQHRHARGQRQSFQDDSV